MPERGRSTSAADGVSAKATSQKVPVRRSRHLAEQKARQLYRTQGSPLAPANRKKTAAGSPWDDIWGVEAKKKREGLQSSQGNPSASRNESSGRAPWDDHSPSTPLMRAAQAEHSHEQAQSDDLDVTFSGLPVQPVTTGEAVSESSRQPVPRRPATSERQRMRSQQERTKDSENPGSKALAKALQGAARSQTPQTPQTPAARPNPLLPESPPKTAPKRPPAPPPPPPVKQPTWSDASPFSPAAASGASSKSPPRPNPLLGDSQSRQNRSRSRPSFDKEAHASPDANPTTNLPDSWPASSRRSSDADATSVSSSRRSRKSVDRKSSSVPPSAHAASSSAFEPAAFLSSMFSAAAPGSSGGGNMLETMFSSAKPSVEEKAAAKRSNGRSRSTTERGASEKPMTKAATEKPVAKASAEKTMTKAATEKPPGRRKPTRTGSSPRGALRTSQRVSPRSRGAAARAATQAVEDAVEHTVSASTRAQSRGNPMAGLDRFDETPQTSAASRVGIEASWTNRQLAPWDADSSASASGSTPASPPRPGKKAASALENSSIASNSSMSRKATSPTKGNKIGKSVGSRETSPLISAEMSPDPEGISTWPPQTANDSRPNHVEAPIHEPEKANGFASVPLPPSFTDAFGRTPSFDDVDDIMSVNTDLVPSSAPSSGARKTAVFGRPQYQEGYGSPERANRRARIATHAIEAGNFLNNFSAKGDSSKKVTLSSLATRTPLVRLPRRQDVSAAEMSQLGAQVHASHFLGQKLHEQRALGATFQVARLDARALLMWYLPYIVVAVLFMALVLVLGAFEEVLLALAPLLVTLPALHLARLAWCDRVLQAAVDSSALAEFHEQVRDPLTQSTNGTFAIALGQTLQPFQRHLGRLLKASPVNLPLRSPKLATITLGILGIVRLLRFASIQSWFAVEVTATACAIVFTVFVACSPTGVRDPVKAVDYRMAILEAAFNSMLDNLRPLVYDVNGGVSPSALPVSPASTRVSFARFPVRLITKDRNTLRAYLHVISKDSPGLVIYCPLGSFTISSGSLDGVAPIELGVSAASATVLANSSSPLNVAAATLGINLGERRIRRREDDDCSGSLASYSTASTLRSKRSNGDYQASDTSLKIVMNMVAKVNAKQLEPLEAFRPTIQGSVLPPKAAVDEPSLLIALTSDSVKVLVTSDEQSSDPSQYFESARANAQASAKADDSIAESFGVLRSSEQLERLCRAPPSSDTPHSIAESTGRRRSGSESDSDGSQMSADELCKARSPQSAADGYLNQAGYTYYSSQHLALVFDSTEERDRCLSLYELYGLMPENSPDWP